MCGFGTVLSYIKTLQTLMFDICIIGSGPSAVISAKSFVDKGFKTCLIDGGVDNDQPTITPRHFSEQLYPEADFVLPIDDPALNDDSGSSQLTKARLHLTKYVAQHLKISSDNFSPLQTLATGGLSAAWGAACFTYSKADQQRASLQDLQTNYDDVAKIIGISGPNLSHFCATQHKQPPAQLDHNGKSLLGRKVKNLILEHSSMAMLTQKLDGREPNPYFDMDFYSNFGDSIFRSEQLLKNLMQSPNFTRIQGGLAIHFKESNNQVTIKYIHLQSNASFEVTAHKLIICGGAINSYRLVANSLNCFHQPNPILTNPYLMIPTIHLPNLGKKGEHLRHSLSQVFAEFDRPDSPTLQFYSYRALLLSRLIAQTPVPPFFARLLWRSLVESLVIVGTHFADDGTSPRSIHAEPQELLPALTIDFPHPKISGVTSVLANLLKLRCLPIGIVKTKMGDSRHYAGTMPISEPGQFPIGMNAQGLIHATKNVYGFDSAGWTYLPSRGLTLTIMANARRLSIKLMEEMCESQFQEQTVLSAAS